MIMHLLSTIGVFILFFMIVIARYVIFEGNSLEEDDSKKVLKFALGFGLFAAIVFFIVER